MVAETSTQILEVLYFFDQERAFRPPSRTIRMLPFLVKKSTKKLSGMPIFFEYAKKLKVKSRTRSVIVLEFKDL